VSAAPVVLVSWREGPCPRIGSRLEQGDPLVGSPQLRAQPSDLASLLDRRQATGNGAVACERKRRQNQGAEDHHADLERPRQDDLVTPGALRRYTWRSANHAPKVEPAGAASFFRTSPPCWEGGRTVC
jgi:hypothetical protein